LDTFWGNAKKYLKKERGVIKIYSFICSFGITEVRTALVMFYCLQSKSFKEIQVALPLQIDSHYKSKVANFFILKYEKKIARRRLNY